MLTNDNMYKLLPFQIPKFWEAIKQATVAKVDSKNPQFYWNRLLQDLLSDKRQCFIGINDERILLRVLIISIRGDEETGEKYLSIESYYSSEALSMTLWVKTIGILKQLATVEGCSSISFISSDKSMRELSILNGFHEDSIDLVLEL